MPDHQESHEIDELRAYASDVAAALLEALRSADPLEFWRARSRLEELSTLLYGWAWGALETAVNADPQLIAILRTRLDGEDPGMREVAAGVLGRLDDANAEVAAALITRLHDPAEGVRMRATQALGRVGRGNAAVTAALIDALADPRLRDRAEVALGKRGDANPAILVALFSRLASLDQREYKAAAAGALTRLARGNWEVGAALVLALTRLPPDLHRVVGGRSWWAEQLSQIGAEKPSFEIADFHGGGALEEFARRAPSACRAVVEVLADPSRAIPELVAALVQARRDHDPQVRTMANRVLEVARRTGSQGVTILLDEIESAEQA